jgi:hypothetical protein
VAGLLPHLAVLTGELDGWTDEGLSVSSSPHGLSSKAAMFLTQYLTPMERARQKLSFQSVTASFVPVQWVNSHRPT